MVASWSIDQMPKQLALLLTLGTMPFAAAHAVTYCGTPQTTTLFTGKTIDAGTVSVANDADNLYVTYTTRDDWRLRQTHVQIAGSPAAVAQNRPGRSKTRKSRTGDLTYQANHNRPVHEYTYAIPRSALDPEADDSVVIAAEAVVVKLDDKGRVIARETGWAGGHPLTGKERRPSVRIHVDECGSQHNFRKAIEGWTDIQGRPFNGTPGALQAEP